MSTPVRTDKWAGNFDCGNCRRKRLMANEFSKKVSCDFVFKHIDTMGQIDYSYFNMNESLNRLLNGTEKMESL